MGELRSGVVKWFNDAKGFGFIEHETGRDIFVHYSVIEADGFKTLKDGEQVEYELSEGDKGLHAARVIRTNAPKARSQFSDKPSTIAHSESQDGAAHRTTASMIEIERNSNVINNVIPCVELGSELEELKTVTEH